MASSSADSPAGGSTPGGVPLRIATWNLGLNTADAFRRDNMIAKRLSKAADTEADMLWKVDVVSLNELHAAHQPRLHELIEHYPGVKFCGLPCGIAICWRPEQ